MGEVYAAFDEKLERDVALKVLSEEGNLTTQKKRLLREARLAAKLTHPNIATVFEVDELGERLYLVMELLEGSSLRRILGERKMGIDEAIGVGRDMARALARAHAGGVIHRDIKPENVFVTQPSPDTLLAKVLDFGLARHRPDGVNIAEQTYTVTRGDLWGTPGYVSPEQAHGQGVDVRTDVFSFGVVLYEMLAGIKPFRGDTPIAVMVATTRTEARPLREITPAVPVGIDEIVHRCLRKDREQRFSDGAALSAALESFIRGNPSPYAMSSVIGSNPGAPVLSPERAGGSPVASAALSGETKTTGHSAAIAMPARDGDAAPLEQQRREHMKLVTAIGGGVAIAMVLVVAILAWFSPGPQRPGLTAGSPLAPTLAPATSEASPEQVNVSGGAPPLPSADRAEGADAGSTSRPSPSVKAPRRKPADRP
jgi:serine/threonine-protein kinase